MTTDEPGIPIPKVDPNGIYCAGCGETGKHAKTCPSLKPLDPFVLANNVDLLREAVQGLVDCCRTINKELATLKDIVGHLINEHDHRIMCLEELQKDPAER